jgi:hypothetical protein
MASEKEVEAAWAALCGPFAPHTISTTIEKDDIRAALSAAEAVRGEEGILSCGHPKSLEIVSIESDYRDCELCEARRMKRDAEAMEIHHRAERDAERAKNASLRALLAKAGEGMEPFQRLADEIDEIRGDTSPDCWSKSCQWSDLVRARALLAEIEKELGR